MRIGIDLGGSKIEAIAIGDDAEVLFRKRLPTPAGDYPATLRIVRRLVDTAERITGRTGSVGIGIPGAISPATGLVKNANSTCLIGHPLDRDLADVLGREVRVANDADCFALSEATDGAGAGYASVFGIILGTGVGGGLVVDGRLLSGPNAIAGEWGHNSLPWPEADETPGPDCYCGRRGCIETFLSGPGLAADHTRQTGRTMTAEEIAAAAGDNDGPEQKTLKRYETRLAKALAGVINIADPAAIVIGGGLSNVSRLYETVPALLPQFVFSDRVETALLAPKHGDSSGVRGAAWLWPAV